MHIKLITQHLNEKIRENKAIMNRNIIVHI